MVSLGRVSRLSAMSSMPTTLMSWHPQPECVEPFEQPDRHQVVEGDHGGGAGAGHLLGLARPALLGRRVGAEHGQRASAAWAATVAARRSFRWSTRRAAR